MNLSSRLYYFDSDLKAFEAKVVQQKEQDGRYYVKLSQTAFYPASGGQPHDTGTIGKANVLDVFVEDGEIVHVVDQPVELEQRVACEIDWERRFDHMQQHCGQHILSAAFEQLNDLDTIGFHLGEGVSTIDVDIPHLTAKDITEAENLANDIVLSNREIVARFIEPSELSKYALRYAPKVSENIRIVTIKGFNDNACGGTHPKRTGQVGLIKVIAQEKVRSATRLTFVCGLRALRDHQLRVATMLDLTKMLSTSTTELPAAVERLLTTVTELRKTVQGQNNKLCELAVTEALEKEEEQIARRGYVVCCLGEGHDLPYFKQFFKSAKTRLEERRPEHTLFVIAEVDGRVHIQAESTGQAHVAGLMKDLFAVTGGKGGGRDYKFQGSAAVVDSYDSWWYKGEIEKMMDM